MPSIGYLQVRAFVSSARIPLTNVAVSVQTPQGTLLAARLTNRSGMLDTANCQAKCNTDLRINSTGER